MYKKFPPSTPPAWDCQVCGGSIAAGRLAANPQTRHCVRCENERERVLARTVAPPE